MKGWVTISGNVSLTNRLKSQILWLTGQFHWYRLAGKPIIIFATRRGGSTLLVEMIASQPGIDFIGEPLNLWRYRPYFDRLPHPPYGRFISLDEDEARILRSYFTDLLSGRIKVFNSWNPFQPTWHFRVHRLVVKLLSANNLFDWFIREFDVQVVYLLRHPVAVAVSCLGLKWGNDAEAYLQNTQFREQILGPERTRLAEEVMSRGTPLQKFVLEWCLENLYPLQVYRERSCLVLAYEEIVSRPREISELICSRLGLPDPERMARMVLRPSRTTFFAESRQAIITQGPQVLLGNWRKRVSEEELREVEQLLDAMGISAYHAFSPYPDSSLCHFGALSEKAEAC